jgi:hypothetical protein
MKPPQSTDQSSPTGQEIDMNARTISICTLAAALMASTSGAYAAQGLDQITVLGFTMSVPHIASRAECQVNMTREDGKTYCFSSDKALDAFMGDALGWGTFLVDDIQKAKETYGFRGA